MRNLLRGSGGVLVFLGAGLLVERPSHWALTDGSRVVTRVGPAWQPAVRICRVSCDVPPPLTRLPGLSHTGIRLRPREGLNLGAKLEAKPRQSAFVYRDSLSRR